VAQALARQYGLKLLAPQALVSEAVAAAEAWDSAQRQAQAPPRQQQSGDCGGAGDGQDGSSAAGAHAAQQGGVAATSDPAPPAKAALGRRLAAVLRAGGAVPDDLLVEAVLIGIEEARTYVVPPPVDAAPPSSSDGSASISGGRKGAGAAKPPKTGAAGASASGAAPQQSQPAAPHPGGPGRGFVLDGFPSTAAQAAALERALTGLDLASEAALAGAASLLAPPPRDALPLLERPLASGLDAAVLLSCGDEAAAAGRALGRRIDPVTGATGRSVAAGAGAAAVELLVDARREVAVALGLLGPQEVAHACLF
jgi:hypothetical protein